MELRLFKTLWGNALPMREAAQLAVTDGFHGLEGPLPLDTDKRREFMEALSENDLLYVAEISTTGYAVPAPRSTVADHLSAFERLLANCLEADPVLCSSMAGSDLWSFRDSVRFFTAALKVAAGYGAAVSFETHRSRSFYHPLVTRDLLRELPGLELTIDFSHWCVVTERLVLDELPEVLELCAERVRHIQPRIGYDQGAQVPDPRAPEYAAPVRAHFAWWRTLWEGQRRRGFRTVTVTPEFGPDGYLHEEPFTRRPVADLREVNVWMAREVERRFTQFLREPTS